MVMVIIYGSAIMQGQAKCSATSLQHMQQAVPSFFQLLTWTSWGKSINTTGKSPCKLVKLPSLKVIC